MAVKLDPDMQAANIAVLGEAAPGLVPGDQPSPPVHQSAGDRMVPPERRGRQRISAEYATAAIRGQSDALMQLADNEQRPY